MRWPLIIANTPFPAIPSATLYEDTWMAHILPNHPEMRGKEADVQKTLEAPHIVCAATAPDYYSFVSNSVIDKRGKPLIVVVSTVDSPNFGVVATSYHGSVEYLNPAQTKWKKHWP